MLQRFSLRLIGLALLSIVQLSPANAEQRDYRFRIEVQSLESRLYFAAHNDGPATVTALVTLVGDNMRVDTPSPKTIVLRAHTTEPIGSAHALGYGQKGSARSWSDVALGDIRAVHAANVRYRLPYENGSSFPISQAFGARLTTHAEAATEHAVDFGLPERTPILAAREGRIVEITLSHNRGGLDPSLKSKANVVQIVHDDGTVATYAHLSQRPAPIKVGDRVPAGALIGYSGDTGYSSGPHLHFEVSRPQLGSDGRLRQVALPVMFYAGVPSVEFAPRRGMEVRAVYAADAPAPGASGAELAAASVEPARELEAAPAVVAADAADAASTTADGRAVRELPPLAWIPDAPPAPAAPSFDPPAPAAAVGRPAEAEPAPDFSPMLGGFAVLLTIIGVLCIASQLGVGRASASE